MTDSFSVVTDQSWLGRLGNAIKGVIFGGILFAAMIILLFWNEGRAVHRAKSLRHLGAAAVTIDFTSVNPANEGKVVHLMGVKADTTETLVDNDFGVSVNALRLLRLTPMYQWVEIEKKETRNKFGGGSETVTTYSYEKQWKSDRVKSEEFHSGGQAGHVNPDKQFNNKPFDATTITAGAFTLSGSLAAKITASAPLTVDIAKVPAARAAKSIEGGVYLGKDPMNPELGDQKILFSAVKPAVVSLVAVQSGKTFRPFDDPDGNGTAELLQAGTLTKDQLVTAAENANAQLTWILRGVGFVVMWIGLMIVFAPLKILADVIPFIGELMGAGIALISLLLAGTVSLITVAIAWIVYRPLLGVGLLLAAAALLVCIRAMRKKKSLPLAAPAV